MRYLPFLAIAAFIGVLWFAHTGTDMGMDMHEDQKLGLFTPDQAPSPNTLEELAARGKEEAQRAKDASVFHGFSFSNRQKESGIDFLGKVVDMPASEYGHGMAVASADVDGDGLPDLFFAGQVGGSQLWKNLGAGKFKNITNDSPADLAMGASVNLGAAFADIDNDGDPDLLVTTVRRGVRLFINGGNGRFSEGTAAAGLNDMPGNLSGAFFFDYDKDGALDLYISSLGGFTSNKMSPDGYYYPLPRKYRKMMRPSLAETQHLFRGDGKGHFTEVTKPAGLDRITVFAGDAATGDLNHDGYPDIVTLNMYGESRYLENEKGQRFVDKTDEMLGLTSVGAMGVKFFDFNNDGLADLYLTDMHSDMTYGHTFAEEKQKSHGPVMGGMAGVYGNAFYLGTTTGRMAEVSDAIGAETYWPWGISAGDFNADGFMDAFVTGGMGNPWRYGINSMLLNEKGKRFVDSEFLVGIEPRSTGPFAPVERAHSATSTVSSRSSVVLDLDNDGDLDLVTNDVYWVLPQVLVSNLTQKTQVHFLKVSLRGTSSNREGLGAQVTVRTAAGVYTQWMDGKLGYLGQSDLPLYFGLGEATQATSVEVRWPSGEVQTVTQGIPRNGTLTITEPQ